MLLLVAMGEAARIAKAEFDEITAHMNTTRNLLASLLVAGLGEGAVRINGPREQTQRLPNTLSIGIKGIMASTLLGNLKERVAASAGAACHSHAHATVSSVLKAMDGAPELT